MGEICRQGLMYLRAAIKTTHGCLVLAGLFVGLLYFPFWIQDLVIRSVGGSTGLVLITSTVLLGLAPLWKNRQKLVRLSAGEADQLLGHLLIVGGVVLFPFFRAELWSQALIWLFILAGITLSTWGIAFLNQYPLTAFLMPLAVYTRPGIIAQGLWHFMVPPYLLENVMAATSTQFLQWMGQPAAVESGRFIIMPSTSVEVAWRCNGFNMAVAMAIMGLLLGIFFQRGWQRILGLMATGIVVGLLFNVPRVMLMVMAAAYWGDWWFDFWHGSWGAQIFVGVLFTAYYYVAMALIKRRSPRATTPQ